MLGKRVKVVTKPGFEEFALTALRADGSPRGGVVSDVLIGMPHCWITWTDDGGHTDEINVSGGWADVELDEPPLTTAERLEIARAEVARIEAEIAQAEREAAEQKAREEREAEDARFPLPEGWRWEHDVTLLKSTRCAVGPNPKTSGPRTLCVHVFALSPVPEIVARGYVDGQIDCAWQRPPLDVVRAVIARYDAEHAPPYSIELARGCYASEVSHTFQAGDVITLTLADGSETRHTINEVDEDGDVWTAESFACDGNMRSCLVGNVGYRHVTKITLVSRAASDGDVWVKPAMRGGSLVSYYQGVRKITLVSRGAQ